jgi:hypothetical protein
MKISYDGPTEGDEAMVGSQRDLVTWRGAGDWFSATAFAEEPPRRGRNEKAEGDGIRTGKLDKRRQS